MADQTPLTTSEIDRLVAEYPQPPPDYLAYLLDFGWGDTPRGHKIYSGPILPDEVYRQLSDSDNQYVLIGDDMQGYCLGYDFESMQYGEFSEFGDWSSFDDTFDLAAYLADQG